MIDWGSLALEVIYIISALVCAVILPMEWAGKAKRRSYSNLPKKYYLTWGHVLKGFVVACIPVYNTVIVLFLSCMALIDVISRLDDMNVFTRGSD